MMLTREDLSQIRKIVREEVGNEVEGLKSELRHEIIMSRMRVQEDIDGVENRIKNMEIQFRRMNKEELEGDMYYADEE